jgi:hypothetical protein
MVWALGSSALPAESRRGRIAAEAAARKAISVPPGPLLAVVSLSRQHVRVFGSTGIVFQSPISSGMAGHGTPTGVFSILERDRYHHSNIYSGAPMPHMQRITWSGVAMHGGVVPGYPASHGCIRLPFANAALMWEVTKVGTRVVVTPDDATPTPFESPLLPRPRLTPAPADDIQAEGDTEPNGPELASAASRTLTDAVGDPATVKARLLDPIQRARLMRGAIIKDAADTTRAAKDAAATAAERTAEARRATAALKDTEESFEAAQRRYDAAVREAESAASAPNAKPEAAERAKAARDAAAADLSTAQTALEQANLIEAVRNADAAAAAALEADKEGARREAAAALKASAKSEEPISVFVSRKAGKVFVRQGWMQIHEAPITFTEGPALGTHVYLAMSPAADRQSLNWVSVSLPPSAAHARRPQYRGRHAAQPAPEPGPTQETAASVLKRFELPAATRRFIEERLWTGASLIVSDNAMSGETGLYTDFIVLTH